MTLRLALAVAVALLALGWGGLLLRRSLPGILASLLTAAGGVVLLAVALLGQSGSNASLGDVIAIAVILVATAGGLTALAVHLAAARAARRADRLEPW